MMQPRCAILGGSWWNGDNAGSRYANVDNWPENSNENIGARGRSDDRTMARMRSRSIRPTTARVRSAAFALNETTVWWSARRSCFGEHTSRSGIAGRREHSSSRPAAGTLRTESLSMTKRYRNLIGAITAPETLRAAYRLTAAGKRQTPAYLSFKEYDALNLAALAADMVDGTYRPGAPHEFFVLDPKRRLISALPFRDRVAQQALCLVIGPIFDRAMLPRSFACRPGKGTHAGVMLLQSEMRRHTRHGEPLFFLKTDFSRYFASIQRDVLWRLIEAKISCCATLRLIEAMLPRGGIGLPIGSLTSQIFANVYTGATLDRHLQQTLGERCWYRYMDDLVVLGRSSEHLRRVKESVEAYSRDELGLRFSKWQIASTARGVNFLGYRIWPHHKLLRRDSVTRARRKIAAYRAAGDLPRMRAFLGAWLGHARWADSANLIRSLGLASQERIGRT